MPQRVVRAFLARVGFRQAKPARGFTIVEVMVAFAVVLVVLIGLTSALTASMRLNTTQKQRALAQDIVRDVVSTYVKNAPYEDINPFDIQDDGTCPDGCSNVTQVVYDASNNTNNLGNYTGLPSLLAEELANLQQPKLELLISPIKKTATEFYATKINVLARLTWDGGGQRVVEMPSVVGMGDLTRTDRARFEKPGPTPTPPPGPSSTPPPTGACVAKGEFISEGLACCTGLAESSGICTCGEQGLAPVGGVCCDSFVEVGGLCQLPVGPTCGAVNQPPVNGLCCTGLNLVGSTCKDCSGKLLPGDTCQNKNKCQSGCCSGSGVEVGSGKDKSWECT